MALSTSSSVDAAEVAEVGGPRWFQVYLLADRGARRALVERAVATGYEALVLTVDLPRVGRREGDHPGGLRRARMTWCPTLRSRPGCRSAEMNAAFVQSMTWDDVESAGGAGFGLPVIVKGILHPDDARMALDHGAAGINVAATTADGSSMGPSPPWTPSRPWSRRSRDVPRS